MTAINADKLWSDSARDRLAAARALSAPELAEVHARLRTKSPCTSWPYGYATSINPLLVTLGVSPGSARSWGGKDPAKEPFAAPTAGKPHPHITRLGRCTNFGDKIHHLAATILSTADVAEGDVYALFGNVVLDPGRSGQAKHVTIRPAFASWVLGTIREHLRPRFLICLGMKGNREAARLLNQTFRDFVRGSPGSKPLFRGYQRHNLVFEEWDVEGPHGHKTKIVYWPQHLRRAPFSSGTRWQDACREFSERHGRLIRP